MNRTFQDGLGQGDPDEGHGAAVLSQHLPTNAGQVVDSNILLTHVSF